ncbi:MULTISPECIES: BACON domain-containing carbohydrate-binding protein [Bacteroides]|jgi:hypothetical protein|uniref:BACON domain-containing protein n=1 Tax=Bacteroides TaxID=816 RepID=UPI00164B6B1B|nr:MULTISPECIES: BACON domain-containing carbohydrate-binding protein [Bacteroides]MBC5589094.1 hypothetical protein [Bacteroides sp. NSJ-39]
MKKYIVKLTLGLMLSAAFITACTDDDDDDQAIAFGLSTEELVFPENGGTESVTITAANTWNINANASWLKITPANGMGSGEFTVSADASVLAEPRTASIRIEASGEMPKTIKLTQMGYQLGVYPSTTDTLIENSALKDKRFFELSVVTNVRFSVEIKEAILDESGNDTGEMGEKAKWLSTTYKEKDLNLDYGQRPVAAKLRFDWNVNVEDQKRAAKIAFKFTDNDGNPQETVVTVTQKAAPTITDNRAGDSLALLIISERLNVMSPWDGSRNMRYWNGVKLWENTDQEVKDNPQMKGRVRSVLFSMFHTEESVPAEVTHLKYVETLEFFSNVNNGLKSIKLGNEVCQLEYLKNLRLDAYGLTELPDINELKKLGDKLEVLSLSSNNFNKIPAVLNKEILPNLKVLKMNANRRRDVVSDLTTLDKDKDGLYLDLNSYADKRRFMEILAWELDTLQLSNNYIEGELPTDKDLSDSGLFDLYTEEDIKASHNTGDKKDELPEILVGTPKVMFKTKGFTVNLNYLHGEIPNWVLLHPQMADWNSFTFIFTQEDAKSDTKGNLPGFVNIPKDFEEYYKLYPNKRPTWEN